MRYVILSAGLLALVACSEQVPPIWGLTPGTGPATGGAGGENDPKVRDPEFSEGLWPCSSCHSPGEGDRARRPLEMHTEIVLKHDEKHRWCLDCHSIENRDMLHLASGELIPFTRSYELCGQCHGDKLRDWRAGVHGRRTGMWNGAKEYSLCINCHKNPHQPHFQPIPPLPPPYPPTFDWLQAERDEQQKQDKSYP